MILQTVRMGEGRPIILLHGLFGAASNWGRLQRRLAEEHLVLAMDARNHGASGHDGRFRVDSGRGWHRALRHA